MLYVLIQSSLIRNTIACDRFRKSAILSSKTLASILSLTANSCKCE